MSRVKGLAPLRRIVRIERGEWITREHLECGHTFVGAGMFAQKRRCKSCLAICPDGGTCHHACGDDPCFRVTACAPLSGVFPNDAWPSEVNA